MSNSHAQSSKKRQRQPKHFNEIKHIIYDFDIDTLKSIQHTTKITQIYVCVNLGFLAELKTIFTE